MAVSYYLSLTDGRLEAAGLVLLMSFLTFIYSVWLFLTLRFHWDAYMTWRKHTLEIKLNTPKKGSVDSSTVLDRPLDDSVFFTSPTPV